MKITHGEVIDTRRSSGAIEAPYLFLIVDEEPTVRGRSLIVSTPGPQISAVQHGMFWKLDPHVNDPASMPEEEIVGYANHSSVSRFDKLVPVEVRWGDKQASMAMPVQRARRLLRKYDTHYQYILSDAAARSGRIQWDLECSPIMCMHWFGNTVCGDLPVVESVSMFGVQMPACHHHISAMRKQAQDLRLERSKS